MLYNNDAAALTREPAARIDPPSRELSFSYGPGLTAGEQEIVFGLGR